MCKLYLYAHLRKTRKLVRSEVDLSNNATLLAGVFPYRTRIAFVSQWWNYNDGVFLTPGARAYKVGCSGFGFISIKHTRQVRQASRFKVGRHETRRDGCKYLNRIRSATVPIYLTSYGTACFLRIYLTLLYYTN